MTTSTAEAALALDRLMERSRGRGPRVGLVLGAGGHAGQAFQAGTLDALAQLTGWEPREADVLVGTSAGSITAALLRVGLTAEDLAADVLDRPLSPQGEHLLEVRGPRQPMVNPPLHRWLRPLRLPSLRLLRRVARDPRTARPEVLVAATLPPGPVSTEPHADGLRALVGEDWPEEPLWITAARWSDGRRTVFGRDRMDTDVATAVAASCSIPGYFTPVRIAGEEWVDGGVHSATNADLLADAEVDVVVAVASMSGAGDTRGLTPDRLLRQRARRLLEQELEPLRDRRVPALVLEPTAADLRVMGVNPMQEARVPDVVRQARQSAFARVGRLSPPRRATPA